MPVRSALQREKDLALTEELSLKGFSTIEIAGRMNVSKERIRRDLLQIQNKYTSSTLRNFDRDLNVQLRKLDLLEREAWRFLADSAQDREITSRRSRTRSNVEGETTTREASTRTEQRDPDTRYMTVIQWCIAERNRLLGLYPAEQINHSGQVSVTEIVYELTPPQTNAGMTIIGGNGQRPALQNGQVEIIGGGAPPTAAIELEAEDVPTPDELWGTD